MSDCPHCADQAHVLAQVREENERLKGQVRLVQNAAKTGTVTTTTAPK